MVEIRDQISTRHYGALEVVYREDDPCRDLGGKVLQSVIGFCFSRGYLVVVYAPHKGYWTPPGGAIEPGEGHDDALAREILEETNMEITHSEIIGYQDAYEPDATRRQVRYFCAVEPRGPFTGDPDGEITEVRLIDPAAYKQYFDWGKIGERVLERACEHWHQMDGS